jgi:hypothetical protein
MIRHLTPEIVRKGGLRVRRDLKAILRGAQPVTGGYILSATQVAPGVWVAVHHKTMRVGPMTGRSEMSTRPRPDRIFRRYRKRVKPRTPVPSLARTPQTGATHIGAHPMRARESRTHQVQS